MIKAIFKNRLGFFLLALFTGLLVGVTTVALIQCVGVLQDILFARSTETDRISWLANKSDWTIILAPVLGGIIVGFILRQTPGNRFHGIADVMEASALRAGKMDVRSGGIVGVATLVSLGAGAPLGREGPAVHIGASLTAWLAEQLGLDRTQSLTLLGCAAAAAVTASFNTPIAGVLFALEVVVGYYSLRVFSPVVVSAMGAVIVRHSVYGNAPEFTLPDYAIGSLWELMVFALLGFVAAIFVQGFIYMVIATQWSWQKTKIPIWMRPAIAGAVVGMIALSYPLILGVGYEGTSLALSEQLAVGMLVGLLITKMIGAAIALGSSFAGGVFSPSLFIGAMLGGAFWYLVNTVIPGTSSQGVYSVVGMAAVASAMLGAPISTLLIVFELTVDYDLVIAVMLASAMASTFMQIMPHGSFFRWQLSERGVNLNTGRNQSLLRTRTIDELVTQNFIEVAPQASLIDVEAAMFAVKRYIAVVVSDEGEFIGSLSTDGIVAGGATDAGRDALCEVVMNDITHAIPDSTSLLAALQSFNELESNYAPVTRTGEGGVEVVGVVYKSDVLKSLYELVRKARSEEYGVN